MAKETDKLTIRNYPEETYKLVKRGVKSAREAVRKYRSKSKPRRSGR